MKVSVVVAVYKDARALELIFESLSYQTYKNFEVVVAEDGQDEAMKKCVDVSRGKYDFEIKHATQEDIGVRKSQSQNNGIRTTNGEYLIFIDGDCILYSKFIENHVLLSGRKKIVAGRRVNLGPKFSEKLRKGVIVPSELEKSFLSLFFQIKKDAGFEKHTEEGIQMKFNGLIHKMLRMRKKKVTILGCNMSMYKEAMLEINGFDEDLGNSAYASDGDLEWRFGEMGYEIVSAKFLANQFHLYHRRNDDEFDRLMAKKIELNKKAKKYVINNGIEKL